MSAEWGVHLYWRVGSCPVDYCVHRAGSYEAAYQWAKQKNYPAKQRHFIKQVGKRMRYWTYSEYLLQNGQKPVAEGEGDKPEKKRITTSVKIPNKKREKDTPLVDPVRQLDLYF